MAAVIRATSKESGEQYTVCAPVQIVPDGEKLRGVMLGLTKKHARLAMPDDPEECAPALMQLELAFGDRYEFAHVRLTN